MRFAGKWEAVGTDPLLALDAKAANEKLLRDVVAARRRQASKKWAPFGGDVAARNSSSDKSHNPSISGLQKSRQSGLKKSWRKSTSAIGSTPTESNYRSSCWDVLTSQPE